MERSPAGRDRKSTRLNSSHTVISTLSLHDALPIYRNAVAPFFSASVLDPVRVVVLNGHRVPNPPFYEEAKALGFTTLPEFIHMASLTFEDVVVFHGEISSRPRSEEHTSELQSHSDLHSFPTRRSSDLPERSRTFFLCLSIGSGSGCRPQRSSRPEPTVL